MNHKTKAWLAAAVVFAWQAPAWADSLHGTVASIIDGDALILAVGREEKFIRLAGIDAPERGQPSAAEAVRALKALCPVGGKASVESVGTDKYKRIDGYVDCGGKQANRRLVELGYAWAKNQNLSRDQEAAKAARRGLWAAPSPVPPWDWRQGIGRDLAEEDEPPMANRRAALPSQP